MAQVVSDGGVEGGRLRIARSRGAASGLLLVLLGAWGALVPFLGPAFDFAYDQGAAWSAARGWLEVLPGIVAVVGGLLLVRSQNRATAMLGGWLSVIAGAWFVIGRVVATTLTIGEIGGPVAETETKAAWLELTYFYGLGAVIVFVGAMALGRLSVRSVRDVGYAQKSAVRRGRRADVVEDSNGDVYQPATTGSLPTQPVVGEPLVEERPRRSWHNPLGRRRGNPTPVGR
ncbi:MAG: hypothetical protein ABW001_13275 [Mycobacterium sp.]